MFALDRSDRSVARLELVEGATRRQSRVTLHVREPEPLRMTGSGGRVVRIG